ncbi:aldehyde dehydrogenase [Aspergillus californicus]
MQTHMVPLIIDGADIILEARGVNPLFTPNPDLGGPQHWIAQGATPELCLRAVNSCVDAFPSWKATSPVERRRLFSRLAELLCNGATELATIIEKEINCSPTWASKNVDDSIAIAEHIAAVTTSGVLSGMVPATGSHDSHTVVFKEPLGVVLGIAPWNAPAVLGLRAVAAPVAAGNCAILKGSELSPRTHYFIAKLFREAGFPPGVVNFLTHRPEDASTVFESLISHPGVRKCNFTGSTAVGRQVAMRAANFLKPVLLELGGKNFVVVLDDANLAAAADMILEGALLNSGQICMSTDIVLVSATSRPELTRLLQNRIESVASSHVTGVINLKSQLRIKDLLDDATAKGASFTTAAGLPGATSPHRAILIEPVTRDMDFWVQESFGPLIGVAQYDDIEEAIAAVNDSEYGLSASLFTKSTLGAMKLARRLNVSAVHINGMTVHDEVSLPHGGHKNSGWGRFGGHWAFDEFMHTQTVIVNPS